MYLSFNVGGLADGSIDYFIVSERFKDRLVDANIHHHILGSDHCPVTLEIK